MCVCVRACARVRARDGFSASELLLVVVELCSSVLCPRKGLKRWRDDGDDDDGGGLWLWWCRRGRLC